MTQLEEGLIKNLYTMKGRNDAKCGRPIDEETEEVVKRDFYLTTGAHLEDCSEEIALAVFSAYTKGYFDTKAEQWVNDYMKKQQEK